MEGRTGTIKIKFSDFGKTYEYPIKVQSPINPSDIALQVSKQIMQGKPIRHKSGKKEIYPAYNLLLSKLPKQLQKIGVEYNLPSTLDNQHQAFQMAYEATKASIKNPEIIKTKCVECNGTGLTELSWSYDCTKCRTCNGTGTVDMYKVNMHRVGMKFNNRLAIDIDDKNLENAMNIWNHCEKMYGYEFELRQTNNGFQLLGTEIYNGNEDWLYDNCMLLNNNLDAHALYIYISRLTQLDESLKNTDKNFVEEFKKSPLCNIYGNFDIMFTVISIKRKAHTLRISKKTPNDKWVLIPRKDKYGLQRR